MTNIGAIFVMRLSPLAVYFIQTGGSALSNTYCILHKAIKGIKSFNSSITTILLEVGSYRTVVG